MLKLRTIVGAALLLPLVAISTAHAGSEMFRKLNGAWTGGGKVRLENGGTERLKCRGYYNAKASTLGIAISCGNASFKINMRAKLTSSGSSLTGTWEERQFNQNGIISGKVTPTGLKLTFSGAISGSMSVKTTGSSQNVSISTGGPGFTGVNLSMRRSS